MGDYAYLRIGRRELVSKNEIPCCWCIIFENVKPNHGIFRLDVSLAKNKLKLTGITLDKLEERIAEFTGWSRQRWKDCREFILSNDKDGLEKKAKEEGWDEDQEEDDFGNVLDLLEFIADDEGLFELIQFYELLLFMEQAKAGETVRLHARELIRNRDYDDPGKLIANTTKNFSDKVSMYNYLFSFMVPSKDQVQLVLDQLQELKEDEIIKHVLVPLLITRGYKSVMPNDYHGPGELGADTQLFNKSDDLEGRSYYVAQVKAINIHTNSRREGHVDSVSHQLSLALTSKFVDPEDNEEKTPDKIMLVTSGRINHGAREFLHRKFPNRLLVIIDGKKLANKIVKYGLFERTMQTINTIKQQGF